MSTAVQISRILVAFDAHPGITRTRVRPGPVDVRSPDVHGLCSVAMVFSHCWVGSSARLCLPATTSFEFLIRKPPCNYWINVNYESWLGLRHRYRHRRARVELSLSLSLPPFLSLSLFLFLYLPRSISVSPFSSLSFSPLWLYSSLSLDHTLPIYLVPSVVSVSLRLAPSLLYRRSSRPLSALPFLRRGSAGVGDN